MDNKLLEGYFLKDRLVEPLTGTVSDARSRSHLPSKANEVLLHLAKHPRRLVDRDELIAKVWGEGHGSADTLSRAIGAIRQALDDHPDAPEFIQTVPTRGYRLLVEPVTRNAEAVSDSSEAPAPSVDRGFWNALVRHGVVQAGIAFLVAGWLLIQIADATFDNLGLPEWSEQFVTYIVVGGFPLVVLLAWFFELTDGRLIRDKGTQAGGVLQGLERNYLAIVAAFVLSTIGVGSYQAMVGLGEPVDPFEDPQLVPVRDNSLAVLQLVTFDDDERATLFAKGLSEDLIDGLARLPGMLVSSRGDSWSLPPNAPSDLVRRRLRVAYFLEGSVRLVDERLRVVVQLIDSATGFHIVSKRFEHELQDFPKLQSEISDVVVANLQAALDQNISGDDLIISAAANPNAYVLYRRGVDVLHQPRTEESIAGATALFTSALNIDPEYPAAHAGLCSANTALFELTRSPTDIDAAERSCAAALTVGPRLSQVLNAVGRLYIVTGRNSEAEEVYQQALETNEQDANAMRGLANIARRAQDFDTAEELMQKAIELQPGNWNAISSLGGLYFRTGRYRDAAAEYLKAVYLDPYNFVALGNLGSASLMAGDFRLARQAIERSLEIETNPTIYSNLGIVHYYLGDYRESVDVHRKVVDLSPESHASWLNLADALHFAGEKSEAAEAFAEAARLSEIQLRVNPEDAEALTLLAWARAMNGELEEAERLATRALQVDPGDPYSHYYAALIHLKSGRQDDALDSLEAATETGYSANMLAAEPYLKELRTNPRFAKLLASAET